MWNPNGLEGFAHSGSAALFSRLVKAAGGDLKYVDMDEPLTFAHAVKIGDTEPIGSTDPTWPAQIRQWIAAYRAATHTPLAFLHADIQWSQDWQQQLDPMKP